MWYSKTKVVKDDVKNDLIYPNKTIIFKPDWYAHTINVGGKIECKDIKIEYCNVNVFKGIKCRDIMIEDHTLTCHENIECLNIISPKGTIHSEESIFCHDDITCQDIKITNGNLLATSIIGKRFDVNGNIRAKSINIKYLKCNDIYDVDNLIADEIYCEDMYCKILISRRSINAEKICVEIFLYANSITSKKEIVVDKIKYLNNISCLYIQSPFDDKADELYWAEKLNLFGFNQLSNILLKEGDWQKLITEARKIRNKILNCKYWTNIERMILISLLNENGLKNYTLSKRYQIKEGE